MSYNKKVRRKRRRGHNKEEPYSRSRYRIVGESRIKDNGATIKGIENSVVFTGEILVFLLCVNKELYLWFIVCNYLKTKGKMCVIFAGVY